MAFNIQTAKSFVESSTSVTPIAEKPQGSILDRAKFFAEQKIIKPIETPEIPKPVKLFPSTMEMLSELQIDPLSLKNNPLDAIGAAWDSLKENVSRSVPQIAKQFTATQSAGEQLKGIAAIGHLVFSPISALFEGANKVPVLGSVSRLLSLPFIAAGEGAPKISDKIVDELPIPEDQKPDIKEGLGEIFALGAQLAAGKIMAVGASKTAELVKRFGEKDAKTIQDKANEFAQQAREPVPPDDGGGGGGGGTGQPLNIKELPLETKMGDIAEVAKQRGFEVPEFGVETPEPTIVPKKKFVEVPREQLPVKMEEAEKGVSALEARMKGIFETSNVKAAKAEAEARGLDISVYDKMSKPEQLRQSAKYVSRTPQYEVLEVLEGKREAPKGLLQNAIMLALEEKSLRDKNVDLAIKLASLRSTRMGQEISILTETGGLSPVSGMNEIIRARRGKTEKGLKQGETIQTKKTSAVKEIKTEQTKFQLKMSKVDEMLKSITC